MWTGILCNMRYGVVYLPWWCDKRILSSTDIYGNSPGSPHHPPPLYEALASKRLPGVPGTRPAGGEEFPLMLFTSSGKVLEPFRRFLEMWGAPTPTPHPCYIPGSKTGHTRFSFETHNPRVSSGGRRLTHRKWHLSVSPVYKGGYCPRPTLLGIYRSALVY